MTATYTLEDRLRRLIELRPGIDQTELLNSLHTVKREDAIAALDVLAARGEIVRHEREAMLRHDTHAYGQKAAAGRREGVVIRLGPPGWQPPRLFVPANPRDAAPTLRVYTEVASPPPLTPAPVARNVKAIAHAQPSPEPMKYPTSVTKQRRVRDIRTTIARAIVAGEAWSINGVLAHLGINKNYIHRDLDLRREVEAARDGKYIGKLAEAIMKEQDKQVSSSPEDELQTLRDRLADLERQLAEARAALEQRATPPPATAAELLERQIAGMDDRLNALRNQREALLQQAAALNQEAETLTHQRSALESALEALTDQPLSA